MLSAEKNKQLTQVGPGTPMGSLLRRYWYPVAISRKLAAGDVQKVRLLGEDLALFRTSDGAVHLLEDRCPHRGVELSIGMVEDHGIRCPYHGWVFDGQGKCLERPCEPPEACRKVSANAYLAQELGGLIFAYIGPQPAPLLPRYDLFCWDDAIRDIGYATVPCNFVQTMENAVDLEHLAWLHARYSQWLVDRGVPAKVPHLFSRLTRESKFERTDYGILMRRRLEGQTEGLQDWSTGHPLIFPNMVRIGGGGSYSFHLRVPIDDENCWAVWYTAYRPGGLPVTDPGPVGDYEVPIRDDRGNFSPTSIEGQDILAWVSQGRIVDRTREHLGAIDRGITLLRRMYFEEMERVASGADPMCVYRGDEGKRLIEFPQEEDKFGNGLAFVRDCLNAAHARFSRRREEIVRRYASAGLPMRLAADGVTVETFDNNVTNQHVVT